MLIQNKHFVISVIAILFAQAGINYNTCVAKSTGKPEPSAATDKRTLQFPEDVSVGIVYLVPQEHAEEKMQGTPAKGRVTITVPPHYWLVFSGSPILCRTPDLIKDTKFKGIDYLKLIFHSYEEQTVSLTDPVLKYLKSFEDISYLNLRHSDATDAGLSNVKGLSKLNHLDIFQTEIHGQCLSAFESLPLEIIDISNNSLSTDSFKALPKLKKLKILNLAMVGPGLNKQAMMEIGKCSQLKELYLGGNKNVDDAGIGYLSGMSELKRLALPNTSVTLNGLKKLKGLKLTHLWPSSPPKSKVELATLKSLFPKCKLLYVDGDHSTDEYTNHLFAPLPALP